MAFRLGITGLRCSSLLRVPNPFPFSIPSLKLVHEHVLPVELLFTASSVTAAEIHDVVVAAQRFELLGVARAVRVTSDGEVGGTVQVLF